MKDASHQGDIYSVIADAEYEAWLLGFREHRDGGPCPHGYGPGDHHWEAGTCLAEVRYRPPARRTRSIDHHTRTSNDFGPDFCAECSAAISEWVSWPCIPSIPPKEATA